MTQDLIWKYATLRDLQIPEQQGEAYCKWKKLYTSAFGIELNYACSLACFIVGYAI